MKPLSDARRWTAAVTVLAPLSWGTTYVTITELFPPGRPLLAAALRVAPAGLVLLAVGAARGRWRPRGREWAHTAALALTNFAVFFPLLVVAAQRLPGGIAAAAGGLQPLLVVAGSAAVTGRRPRPVELGVGIVAAAGVALVVVGPGASFDTVGVLAAVGANVSFATGVVLTKRLPTPGDRLAATGWQLTLGALVLVPLALAVEGAPPTIDGRALLGVGYLSLVGTALAFVLWFDGIRRLPASAPPLLGLAAPVTGAALGWALLGQALSSLQLIGFVVVLGAIAHGATRSPSAPAATARLGTDRRAPSVPGDAVSAAPRRRHSRRRPRRGPAARRGGTTCRAPAPGRPGPAGRSRRRCR